MRRVGDLKGPGSKVNDVLTELFPMVDVENLPGELLALGGWKLGIGASNLLAAAAETAKIQVFNPIGSGVIATVTTIVMSVTSAQRVRISSDNAARSTGIGVQIPRDLRHGILRLPTCAIFQESSPGSNNANGIFQIAADDPITLHDPNGLFILTPGTGCSAGHEIVATRLIATFFWRERTAEPSELNF